ncbi:Cytokine receptor-like factor 3 [Saguinus oedipus]|uniref:Cytokine receptor-like factor 3 n=1 Tax=Saguinus oedipus TaxID=9490 RepID=A0ABQ9VQL8_SAGOE|nr:Cytokine receptor-like factor 3 [Saguinus oedipus]
MELEPELLLQEARESVEAAQSYRRELGHRLEGLREARRQELCGPGDGAGF